MPSGKNDLRADALAYIDNTVKKERVFYFIEVDNGTNPFKDKYRKAAEALEFSLNTPWWYVGVFPRVLVTGQPAKVREIVKDSPVRYCVATPEQVRENVYKCQYQ